MKSDECKYGLEIEFHSGMPRYDLAKMPVFSDFFIIGTDNSAVAPFKLGYGVEVRHRIAQNKTELIESLDVLHEFFKMNSRSIFCHKRTGFHLHFSHPEPFRNRFIEKELIERYQDSIHQTRKEFCMDMEDDKYCPLRRIPDSTCEHWEARVFNGSLKIRAIRNYLKFMFHLIDNA